MENRMDYSKLINSLEIKLGCKVEEYNYLVEKNKLVFKDIDAIKIQELNKRVEILKNLIQKIDQIHTEYTILLQIKVEEMSPK